MRARVCKGFAALEHFSFTQAFLIGNEDDELEYPI